MMINVRVEPHYTFFLNCQGPSLFRDAYDIFAARPEGYYWMPSYRSGNWDGYYRFVRKTRGYGQYDFYLPTGLLYYSKKFIDYLENWMKIDILDRLKRGDIPEQKYKLKFKLRDYQKEALKKALKKGRGILNLATNAGKTEIAIAIASHFNKVVFIVHRATLAKQTQERFQDRLGIDIGLIGAGKKDYDADFVVATVQSLHNMQKKDFRGFSDWAYKYEAVFWDEVHHLKSDSWFKIHPAFRQAWYRYGLSATIPSKKSEGLNFMKLMAATGPVIYKLEQKKLVEKGYSTEPVIYPLVFKHEKDLDKQYFLDYAGVVKYYINTNPERNGFIYDIVRHFRSKNVVILLNKIEHANEIKQVFERNNLKVHVLTGRQSSDKRMKILEQFKKRKIKRLIVTNWFDEGMDIPEIDLLILASGGKSERSIIQRVGRALRKSEFKNRVVIVDILDSGVKYLTSHAKKRLEIFKNMGFEVKVFKNIDKFVLKTKEVLDD